MATKPAVEKITRTCPKCKHRFSVRKFQRNVRCPKCGRGVERGDDRHDPTTAGMFIRLTEAEKDWLERRSHESMRSQASILREAVNEYRRKHP